MTLDKLWAPMISSQRRNDDCVLSDDASGHVVNSGMKKTNEEEVLHSSQLCLLNIDPLSELSGSSPSRVSNR